MKTKLYIFIICLLCLLQVSQIKAQMKVRIKDVTRVKGLESTTLIGYGLVVGLAGTGDSDEELTQRTISNLLQNFNVVIDLNNIKAQNTAAVIVTATIESIAHKGDMIPATVSSIGDASSLTGGELLLTPILGGDGKTWATGQGAIVTGGFSFGSSGAGGSKSVKNHPTVGRLTNGIKLIKDIKINLFSQNKITLFLTNPDFTSSSNMAKAINLKYPGIAMSENSGTVKVRIPDIFRTELKVSDFMREVEQIEFAPDTIAKVVFNERTGTIIFGENVKISTVAISHGSLSITISKPEEVSQPAPFSNTGTTTTTANEQTNVEELSGGLKLLPNLTTVGQLVSALNALGATSRDIMIIMHALSSAGALHAKLESM